MIVEKFQTSKVDTTISKVVLYAEEGDDKELLQDILDYIAYLEEEKERAKNF